MNMEVKVILIVVGTLGRVSRSWEKGLEEVEICERIDTVQTTILLRSTRTLRSFLET